MAFSLSFFEEFFTPIIPLYDMRGDLDHLHVGTGTPTLQKNGRASARIIMDEADVRKLSSHTRGPVISHLVKSADNAKGTFKLCIARNGWCLDAVFGALFSHQKGKTECLKYGKYGYNCDGFHDSLSDCFCWSEDFQKIPEFKRNGRPF